MNEVLLDTTATMMKDKYTHVCDTNNLGVEHLEAGNFERARVAFAQAIQAARELAKAFVDNDDEDNIWPGCEAPPLGTEISSPDLMFLTRTIHTHGTRDHSNSSLNATTSVEDFASTGDGAFVYHRAFKLRRDHAIPHLEIICCAILYNMGIGFHMHDVVSCSQRRLKHAITCYSLALSMYYDEGTRSRKNSSTTSWQPSMPRILHLALLNNLGEVLFRLSRYDEMVRAYTQLQKWRADIVLGGPLLNAVERYGLLWNILFLKKPFMAAAA